MICSEMTHIAESGILETERAACGSILGSGFQLVCTLPLHIHLSFPGPAPPWASETVAFLRLSACTAKGEIVAHVTPMVLCS